MSAGFDPTRDYSQEFKDGFQLLTQTMGGKIAPFMRVETYSNAESVYYDQMAAVTEDDRNTRYGRTNFKSIATDRRRLFVEDKVIAVQIDEPDENRTLSDIRNPTVIQAANAWKRARDIAGIKGALGVTYSGKNGETSNDFDWTNQLVTSASALTKDRLIAAKQLFWQNSVDLDDPSKQLHMAITGEEAGDLLKIDEFVSSDYNQKALMAGEVVPFLGIQFHITELLPYMNSAGTGVHLTWQEDSTYGYLNPVDMDNTGVRACFMWAQDTVCVGTNQNYKTWAGELPEYNLNFGIINRFSIGYMRQEEKTVVAVPCS